MWIYIVPAFFTLILVIQVAVLSESPAQQAQRDASGELERYRLFVSTADTYFKSVAPPSVTTSYTWDQIRGAAAPANAAVSMRLDWKVVRAPDGQWAACTELNELSVAALNEIYAPALPASGASSPISSRVLPERLASGGKGQIPFTGAEGLNGLVAVGSSTEAMKAANLCDGAG